METGVIWKISMLSTQFFLEPKTALKQNLLIKNYDTKMCLPTCKYLIASNRGIIKNPLRDIHCRNGDGVNHY